MQLFLNLVEYWNRYAIEQDRLHRARIGSEKISGVG